MSAQLILHRVLFAAAALIALESHLLAAGDFGEDAPDFPPGAFNDGGRYQVADFKGKVLVLFFYEKDCPRCRGMIPQRNDVVEQYKGKPVKFIAIAAGDTLPQAKQYAGGTRLAMPVFADSLGLMQKRYGQEISLNNIWQFRVIGADGKVVGYTMDPKDIDRALEAVKPKYDPSKYHEKLRGAVEACEWNQHGAGMRILKSMLKKPDAELVKSARKLSEDIKEEGAQWLKDADETAESEPVKAYDLYTKVSMVFKDEEIGKKAAAAAKKLKENKLVKDELEARKMYDRLSNAMAQAGPDQKTLVVKFIDGIIKKYPDTPTGKKVDALKAEIGA